MSAVAAAPIQFKLPTHLDLPDTDGKPVDNTYQPLQWKILQDSLTPHMRKLHPDGKFLVAMDHGIYFKITDPPLQGCRVADLLVVEGVPPVPDDYIYRRSYVLWQDLIAPTLVTELVSGDGKEERDTTPHSGKFWIYEKLIKAGYYIIYDPDRELLEVYRLEGTQYQPVKPNSRGHFPIQALGVEVGVVNETYDSITVPWLRFFDLNGKLLPIAEERAAEETARADREQHRAEQEKHRAEQEKHRAEQEKHRAEQEKHRAEQEKHRAEQEKHRAERLEQRNAYLLQKLRDAGIDPNGSPTSA